MFNHAVEFQTEDLMKRGTAFGIRIGWIHGGVPNANESHGSISGYG